MCFGNGYNAQRGDKLLTARQPGRQVEAAPGGRRGGETETEAVSQ